MKRYFTLLFILLSAQSFIYADIIRGIVKDAQSGEEIIGAFVILKEQPSVGAASGLDGTFSISTTKSPCTLVCSYIGYKQMEFPVNDNSSRVTILLEPENTVLHEVTIVGHNQGRTEAAVRELEKQALNVINITGASEIERSPDLTVANVIHRMSGVTMERNSSGEGQYAILRGMDKRYNYTLVNGVKIPSPDSKNRFVPLDIFPAELLDRLEVVKSLTANMEGDGIGGAVNMVMKDAPDEQEFSINASTGYSSHFFDHDFQSFDYDKIADKSPNEKYGPAYPADATDFTTGNLRVKTENPLPDIHIGASYGNRFLKKRLGLIAAVSFSNRNKGKTGDIYDETAGSDGLQPVTNRLYSEQQTSLGSHLKIDYKIGDNHKLAWYNGLMDFKNTQVRDAVSPQEQVIRLRHQQQQIFNSTLSGEHRLLNNGALLIKWKGNIASAENKIPDNAQIQLNNNKGSATQWVNKNTGAIRRWEHNSDDDISGHIDLSYKRQTANGGSMEFMAGGMYRDKQRSSFYNEYTFQPYDASKGETNSHDQFRNADWNNYDEISFQLKSRNLSDPMNYDATEKILAEYAQIVLNNGAWQITAGLRAEHTRQGYTLLYPTDDAANEGTQKYTDLLPSAHIRYKIHKNANIRFSYYKAINRPSFFEIVPYHIINEDYNECGNPDLKHTTAHSFDLRYEYFPRNSEQFMACLFYKQIKDPIEYGMQPVGQETFYTPGNYGNAKNYGIEIDVTKYFRRFGIKANYTYTHSEITTDKLREIADASGSIRTENAKQTRPLFGQAEHVFNVSFLLKDTKHGWDGQLALSHTGKRLAAVDRFYENDRWDAEITQLDLSIEKRWQCGVSLFFKGQNLLDTPLIRYYNSNERNATVQNVRRYNGGIVEREEKNGRSFQIGLRYKL